jgi:serine phosphatase RsbU (regulator of sigma subunit)
MASEKLETATKTCLEKSGFRISSDAATGLAQRIILNAIFGALKNHTRGVRQNDDMTLVIIKVE